MVRLILCGAKRYWSQDNCELTFENQSVYEGFQRENIILIMNHLLSVTPPANFMSFTSQWSVVVARNNRFCNDCSKLAQLLSFLWKQAKLLVSIEQKAEETFTEFVSRNYTDFDTRKPSKNNKIAVSMGYNSEMNTALAGTINNYDCRSFQGNIMNEEIPIVCTLTTPPKEIQSNNYSA